MEVEIPELALVLLVGPSGSGKSTFAHKHFQRHEVISFDECRGLVSNDPSDQSSSSDALKLLHFLADIRLRRGLLTVIDATNVSIEDRKGLIAIAKSHDCYSIAIVFDLPEKVCVERNLLRPERSNEPQIIHQQKQSLKRSLGRMLMEGFRACFELTNQEQIDSVVLVKTPLNCDRKSEMGPFDIIGDLHGCCDELELLLDQLGYRSVACSKPLGSELYLDRVHMHPDGRRAIFVGDYVDRGPRSVDTLRVVATMAHHGHAFCLPGNHDVKLLRKINGKDVQLKHGLAETMADFDRLPKDARAHFENELRNFIDGLVSHLIFDNGNLVVAHAGLKLQYHGRTSGRVREFCLYGDTTGEVDQYGMPVRLNWAADYRGNAHVIYGHTPVASPEWLNHTANVDTGCVFGGKLTALRYPEKQFVSVPAKKTYCEPSRPFLKNPSKLSAQQQVDLLSDIEETSGKWNVSTNLISNITIQQKNGFAALQALHGSDVDPRWLIYLPPTMSPCETSSESGLLEHPQEVFSYFRSQGVQQVVCQEKHMGSRAVIILCKDHTVAKERFGIEQSSNGVIYSRTGRTFFSDLTLEQTILDQLKLSCEQAGFWDRLQTDWLCLDSEIMPWSAKAVELYKSQNTADGITGNPNLKPVLKPPLQPQSLPSSGDQPRLSTLMDPFADTRESMERFIAAYRQNCKESDTLQDWRIAPFHLLATEGKLHSDKSHQWHLKQIESLHQANQSLICKTDHLIVNVADKASVEKGIQWWLEKTSAGSEGMVVKPLEWILRSSTGLVQPAIKCRSKEYLRIIYGPDYDTPENIAILRKRELGRKRSLAIKEFALGLEALERFVRHEPLQKVLECIFSVLALENEPVDPRL